MDDTPTAILEQINELQRKIALSYSGELIKARIRIAELEQENKDLKVQLESENNNDES